MRNKRKKWDKNFKKQALSRRRKQSQSENKNVTVDMV